MARREALLYSRIVSRPRCRWETKHGLLTTGEAAGRPGFRILSILESTARTGRQHCLSILDRRFPAAIE
jgi:hypothetical protein